MKYIELWRCPGCNGVKPSVQVYNESVFRNNIVQDVAGATAVEVGGNSIVERNIIGDYKRKSWCNRNLSEE